MAKRQKKRHFLWLIPLIFLMALAACWFGWRWYDNNVDRSGWVKDETGYYYRDFHGKNITGWKNLEEKDYYFSDTGLMVTDWQELEGKRFYFGTTGVLQRSWQEIDGARYYLGEDGAMVTGWLDYEGAQYYLNAAGNPVTGWQDLDGARYYFTDEGTKYTGWLTEADGTYYLNESGNPVTGELEMDGSYYRFDENGTLYTGWYEMGDARCYYLPEGPMAQDWQEIDGKYYYFGAEGVTRTGWLELGENLYYLTEDGSAAVGPYEIDGETRYFTPKGIHVVLVNRDHTVPEWYDSDLVTYTGWHRVSKIALEPLKKMLADCEAAGNQYWVNSCYRSRAQQQQILEEYTTGYMENDGMSFAAARAKAYRTVAVPGTSEHHLGLAMDIMGTYAIPWLTEHCWEYGFILRYTGEKESITGFVDEPWHYRYVGVDVAMDMKDSGLCLEEYLGAVPEQAAEEEPEE